MSSSPQGLEANRRGGKLVPALCNIFGTLILVSVIALYLPITLAHARGYEVYDVVSSSMEPAIPVGSVIYVETLRAEDVAEGDVIAFHGGSSVIAHRVVKNRVGEGEFITKGDANQGEDMTPTPYGSLIGKVVFHIPYAGVLMTMLSGTTGKIYAVLFAVCGVLLRMVGGILEKQGGEKEDGV